jgi:3-deoxy-7-phosphoheptulonate synthase
MIIVMKAHAEKAQIDSAIKKVEELGYTPHPIFGVERTVIAAVGDERGKAVLQSMESLPGVDKVVPILQPYKLASSTVKAEKSVIMVGDVPIGGDELIVVAGPCAVEGEKEIIEVAHEVKKSGARLLRGGAFKPRTSPYSFQGYGEEGLKMLKAARDETGLPVVTEIMTVNDIDLFEKYVDCMQIGARNVQNFSLLKVVGQSKIPVFLKRGMATTIQEFLMSAEYILSEGNDNVILCERGIRTFETATRNTLDLNAVPVIHERSHLPVAVDPSHGTGYWQYVEPMAKAGIAAGADCLMIEVHPDPPKAFSDGGQSLKYDTFANLMKNIKPFVEAAGRKLK